MFHAAMLLWDSVWLLWGITLPPVDRAASTRRDRRHRHHDEQLQRRWSAVGNATNYLLAVATTNTFNA